MKRKTAIDKALEPTGKAETFGGAALCYVDVNEAGLLKFSYKESGEMYRFAELSEILDIDWQPYYEEEVIRPKEAGEL